MTISEIRILSQTILETYPESSRAYPLAKHSIKLCDDNERLLNNNVIQTDAILFLGDKLRKAELALEKVSKARSDDIKRVYREIAKQALEEIKRCSIGLTDKEHDDAFDEAMKSETWGIGE